MRTFRQYTFLKRVMAKVARAPRPLLYMVSKLGP